MPPDTAALASRIDDLDAILIRDGRAPTTDEQRDIVLNAYRDVGPPTAQQQLALLRLLRTSDQWSRVRVAT